MPENRLSALKNLWSPAGVPAGGPIMTSWRLSMINAVIGVSTLVLAPIAFLSALFLHLRGPAEVGIVILAVFAASYAVLLAYRIRLAFQLGRWIGWKRKPIPRGERPALYWILTATHLAVLALNAATAVLLIWVSLGLMTGR